MKTALYIWCVLFHFFLNAQDINTLNQPEICFETKTIDFGKIEAGSDGTFTFDFTNCGKQPLIISNGQSSCGCLICYWPKEPIMPGQKSRIQLKYDTRRMGPMTKTATINSNAASDPVVLLKLKGTVVPVARAVIADSTIDFGTVKPNQKLHFDLINKGPKYPNDIESDTLRILKIEQVSESKSDLVPTKNVLEKAETAQLEFSAPNQEGIFRYEWKIYFNDKRDPILLNATGRIRR